MNGTKLLNDNHGLNGGDEKMNDSACNNLLDKKNLKQHQQQQGLNGAISVVSNGNTASGQNKGNSASTMKEPRIGAKLGSDGESEASPETSLSPLDVDSMEGKTLILFFTQLFPLFS